MATRKSTTTKQTLAPDARTELQNVLDTAARRILKDETVDLHEMLVTALKAKGIEPELRWSPTGSYASYRVDGKTIGYVAKQTRSGINVQAGITIDELPKAQREHWKSREQKSAVFAATATFGDAKGIERAAVALALAAEKQAKARAEKAAPTVVEPVVEPVVDKEGDA